MTYSRLNCTEAVSCFLWWRRALAVFLEIPVLPALFRWNPDDNLPFPFRLEVLLPFLLASGFDESFGLTAVLVRQGLGQNLVLQLFDALARDPGAYGKWDLSIHFIDFTAARPFFSCCFAVRPQVCTLLAQAA